MCGIAGVLNLKGFPLEEPTVAIRMASSLVHRGPDEEGSLVDGPVAFGFRRLRIIDLETGQQPVSNEPETMWVMLNGEIYNFVELRYELEKRVAPQLTVVMSTTAPRDAEAHARDARAA